MAAIAAVMACSLTLLGCPRDLSSTTDEVGKDNGPLTRIAGFDHQGLRAALQGDWLIVRGDKRLLEFEISEEQVRVVDHRFAQPRTTQGELLLRSATSFGVQDSEGPSYFFGFVVVDGTTYMGQGGAIAVKGEEDFEAKLGAWETLVRTESGCKLVTTFGRRATDKEVECGFHERKGAKGGRVFRYEAPDPFRPDRLKPVELRVVGDYLMEDELFRSVASRRGESSPVAPTQPTSD